MKQEHCAIIRWSLFSVLPATLFWTIWYLINGNVPMGADYKIASEHHILSFLNSIPALSRWFDIIIFPVCATAFLTIFAKEKIEDEGALIMGSVIAFVVSMVLSFFVHFYAFENKNYENVAELAMTIGMISGLCMTLSVVKEKYNCALAWTFTWLGVSTFAGLFFGLKLGILCAFFCILYAASFATPLFVLNCIFMILSSTKAFKFYNWLSAKQ